MQSNRDTSTNPPHTGANPEPAQPTRTAHAPQVIQQAQPTLRLNSSSADAPPAWAARLLEQQQAAERAAAAAAAANNTETTKENKTPS